MNSDRFDWLADDDVDAAAQIAAAMDQRENDEWPYHWGMTARDEQLPPPGDWRIWLILAGRGFGKTRSGAEWVREIAERCPDARIALVATTLSEARAVMVEGESGIIACCAPDNRPVFETSLKRLRFPNGAQALIYSAQEPESLRGPQHSHACRAGAEGVFRQSVALGAGCAGRAVHCRIAGSAPGRSAAG
jgi:phage terminase large subunit-like protein